MIAFFGPLREQNFTSMGLKGHGLWLVHGGFWSILCVSVFQSLLLVIILMTGGTNCEGGFWTLEFGRFVKISVKHRTNCLHTCTLHCVSIARRRKRNMGSNKLQIPIFRSHIWNRRCKEAAEYKRKEEIADHLATLCWCSTWLLIKNILCLNNIPVCWGAL